MKPSSLRMRAISTFRLESGTSTRSLSFAFALRILVNRSAIGSVVIGHLPRGFLDARDVPLVRHLAETDPAQPEVTHVAPRAPADLAAVAITHRELLGLLHL